MDDQFNSKDVIIESDNGNQIYYYHDEYPGRDWTFYSISLDTAGTWLISNDHPASMSEIEAVLSAISVFWIRGEYQTGPDTGGLDHSRLME